MSKLVVLFQLHKIHNKYVIAKEKTENSQKWTNKTFTLIFDTVRY